MSKHLLANHLLIPRSQQRSTISDDIQSGYFNASYQVVSNEKTFGLKIGEHNRDLQGLHQSLGVTCSVFISIQKEAQTKISSELTKRKLKFLPGTDHNKKNVASSGILILGLGRDGSHELIERHGLEAAIWSDEDAIPKLILTR